MIPKLYLVKLAARYASKLSLVKSAEKRENPYKTYGTIPPNPEYYYPENKGLPQQQWWNYLTNFQRGLNGAAPYESSYEKGGSINKTEQIRQMGVYKDLGRGVNRGLHPGKIGAELKPSSKVKLQLTGDTPYLGADAEKGFKRPKYPNMATQVYNDFANYLMMPNSGYTPREMLDWEYKNDQNWYQDSISDVNPSNNYLYHNYNKNNGEIKGDEDWYRTTLSGKALRRYDNDQQKHLNNIFHRKGNPPINYDK